MSAKINKTAVTIIAIFIAGFFLRLYRIDSQSFWYDELCTSGRITLPLFYMIETLTISPFSPLYHILMNLWTKIFEVSAFTFRFPSLLWSSLSIIFIFKLGKGLFNKEIGLIAALLLSISPYSVNYAQEAKMYALLWLLGLLSFYFFHKFFSDYKIRHLVFYIVTAAMSIYTMYLGFIFIIVQDVIFFIFFSKNKEAKIKWLLGQLAIIILYLPWMGFFVYNATRRTGIHWIPKIDNYYALLQDTFMLVMGLRIGKTNTVEVGAYLFLIISAFAPVNKLTKNDWMIILWIAIPIIIYFLADFLVYPVFITRYIGFIHIPLILLVSKGINKYNKIIKSALLIVLVLFTFTNHLIPYFKDNLKINGENWQGLFRELQKRAPGNALLLTNIGGVVCFNRGIKYLYGAREMKKISKNTNDVGQKYDAIFVIYRSDRPKFKLPFGYALVGNFCFESNGYKEDKNLKVDIGFLHYRMK